MEENTVNSFRLPLVLAAGLGLAVSGAAAQQTDKAKTSPGASSQSKMDTAPSAMTQTKLKQSLEKAGFTDVRIADANYLIHAKTENGDSVVMFINPPSVGSKAMTGADETDTSKAKKK